MPLLLMGSDLGDRSLAEMAQHGRDEEASRIICAVAAQLHAPRPYALPPLHPLPDWFAALEPAAAQHGGVLRHAASMAHFLLAEPQDVVVLHGDMHHGNILDTISGSWLAIDPKGLIGERCFDFPTLFCTPDFDVATTPGRLVRQVEIVVQAADLDRVRLLQWILAYAGLSTAWFLEGGENPLVPLSVAELAAVELVTR